MCSLFIYDFLLYTGSNLDELMVQVVSSSEFGSLKAYVCYFHQIFIISPNNSPVKTMKNAFYFI